MELDFRGYYNQPAFNVESPQEVKTKQLALQNAQMQQTEYERKMRKSQQDDDDEEAMKGIFRNSLEQSEDGSTKLNEQKLLQGLYNKSPEMAMKLQQQFQERDINAGKLTRDNQIGAVNLQKGQLELENLRNPKQEIAFAPNGTPYNKNDPSNINLNNNYSTPKPPQTRTIRMGDEQVTQQFNEQTGQFDEIGRGGAFAPDRPNAPNLPTGWEANPAGGIQRMKGFDQTETTAKPLPTTALKMQNEALDKLSIANNNNVRLGSVVQQLDNGTLNLGLFSNLTGKAKNFAGYSDESSRNLSSFKSTLEKLRNDSLRLNTGVQTDGDAQRAWAELFENINDKDLVKQRLIEIQEINTRGADLQKLQIENIRSNYNAEPVDFSRYEIKQKTNGNILPPGAKMPATAAPKKLGSSDSQAITWAKKNPNDPRAKKILQIHGLK